MYSVYEKWPEFFKEAARIKVKLDHTPDYYHSVIHCGVGGSATGNDIMHEIMCSFSKVPSAVLRGENIPPYTDKHSLTIVTSASGNTEETVAMMKDASDKGAEVICITSGGLLQEEAAKRGHKIIQIPNVTAPRALLPYLVMPQANALSCFLKEHIDGSSVYSTLRDIANQISINTPKENNIAKQVSSFINGGFAFCFTSTSLLPAGIRFKNSLNENAKIHCLVNSALEASHNEIVPFTYRNSIAPKTLLLRWSGDSDLLNQRFEKIRSLFLTLKQPVMEINSLKGSLFGAMLASIYILDYSTIYLAVERRIDPSPTPAIDILKQKAIQQLKVDYE
jgi:glucose/mannose-6-phosphate isomerase